MDMKILCVKAKDWQALIPATKVEREESVLWAYNGNELAGMFDLGEIVCFYMTDRQRKEGG